MLGSCSDHSRIVPALEMTFHLFLDIFFEILQCNFAWQAQYLARLARDTCCSARTVNDVSNVMRTKYVSLSAWQVQYLVQFKCYFSW